MTAAQIRAAGAVGVVAVVFFIIAFIVDPTPPIAGSPASEVAAHITKFSVGDRIAGFFFGASGALLVAFVAGFRQLVLEHSSRTGWYATAMLAGAIHAGTMLTATSVLFFTLGATANTISPGIAAVLSNLANYGFIFAGFGTLVFVASATVLMLGARGALRVLGELGVVVTLVLVLYVITAFPLSGPFTAGAVVSIICFSVAAFWIALCSLAMLTLEPHALIGKRDTLP